MRKLTQEVFEQRAKSSNNKVIVKGQYKNAKEKVLCECVFCHKDLWIAPDAIYKNVGCNDCSSKASGLAKIEREREIFYRRAAECNDKLIVVGQYRGAEEKVHCICVNCGDDVYALPGSIYANHGCRKCSRSSMRKRFAKDPESFMSELSLINQDDLMIGPYVDFDTKIEMQCGTCDSLYSRLPYDLLHKKRCPLCAQEFVSRLKALGNEELQMRLDSILPGTIVLGEYKNQNTPILVECPKGHQWETTPKNLLAKHGCPFCRGGRSTSEVMLTDYLLNKNVTFERPKVFDDLIGVGGRKLSYDFYLPDYQCLVEIQGDQHLRPIPLWGGEEQFVRQQEHDRRKRQYAEEHGYTLLEIWSNDLPNLFSIIDSIFNPVTITA